MRPTGTRSSMAPSLPPAPASRRGRAPSARSKGSPPDTPPRSTSAGVDAVEEPDRPATVGPPPEARDLAAEEQDVAEHQVRRIETDERPQRLGLGQRSWRRASPGGPTSRLQDGPRHGHVRLGARRDDPGFRVRFGDGRLDPFPAAQPAAHGSSRSGRGSTTDTSSASASPAIVLACSVPKLAQPHHADLHRFEPSRHRLPSRSAARADPPAPGSSGPRSYSRQDVRTIGGRPLCAMEGTRPSRSTRPPSAVAIHLDTCGGLTDLRSHDE